MFKLLKSSQSTHIVLDVLFGEVHAAIGEDLEPPAACIELGGAPIGATAKAANCNSLRVH